MNEIFKAVTKFISKGYIKDKVDVVGIKTLQEHLESKNIIIDFVSLREIVNRIFNEKDR